MIIEFWKGTTTWSFAWFYLTRGMHFSLMEERLEDLYQRRDSTLPPSFQQLQPKVKKRWSWSLQQNIVRYQLCCFVFPPALNFTFWNIISFAFRSRKAGRLKLPKSCRLSCIFFTFFLPQRAKVKGICLWRHCWRFKGHII